MAKFGSVPEYVDALTPEGRAVVEEIRTRVGGVVAGVGEVISYDMPTFTLDGRRFMHVGCWKNHVSIYPVPGSDPELATELAPYVEGKGTLKLPLGRPIPWELVERVAVALAREAGSGR